MAHKKETREFCKQLYLIDGKSIDEISRVTQIPYRTILNWRKKESWDSQLRTGNIELSLHFEKELITVINKAIEDNTLSDPKIADTISKLQKVANSLRPQRQILGNLLLFIEELANYASNANDAAFLRGVQKHLPSIADHIKDKYQQKK